MAEMVFYNLLSTYLLRCNLFKQDFLSEMRKKSFQLLDLIAFFISPI